MTETEITLPPSKPPAKTSTLKLLGIIAFSTVLATITALVVAKFYLFPSQFSPVQLSAKENRILNNKLDRINTTSLKPQKYSEKGLSREILFSEKELNALLAKNTNLAQRLAIDLSNDLASARLLIPLDKDFPILGGQTLKVSAGVELRYQNNNPVVILQGVSVWGVPLPNAWLGNLKHIDLIKEFGSNRGFWHAFAEGIESIRIEEGKLRAQLKE